MGIFSWYQTALCEISLRVILLFVYLWVHYSIPRLELYLLLFRTCEFLPPFERAIQPEELWLYKYPHTESYISMSTLWILALSIPLATILGFYIKSRNGTDVHEALLCLSLIISVNGAITNAIKVMVGKPLIIRIEVRTDSHVFGSRSSAPRLCAQMFSQRRLSIRCSLSWQLLPSQRWPQEFPKWPFIGSIFQFRLSVSVSGSQIENFYSQQEGLRAAVTGCFLPFILRALCCHQQDLWLPSSLAGYVIFFRKRDVISPEGQFNQWRI